MMSLINTASIFIPCGALNKISKRCWVFGYFSSSSNSTLISCTIFLETENMEDIKKVVEKLVIYSPTFSFLGVLYSARKRKDFKFDALKVFSQQVSFIIRIDESSNSLYLENIFMKSSDARHSAMNQIILYDNYDFIKSQMFQCKHLSLPEEGKNNFVSFLSKTLKDNCLYSKDFSKFSKSIIFDCSESSPNYYQSKLFIYSTILLSFLFAIISKCLTFFHFLPFRFYEIFLKILTSTSVGCQLHQRLLHFGKIIREFKSKEIISLEVKNLVSAVVFDLLIGWLITFTFLHSNVPLLFFDLSLEQTNNLVSNLQRLIHWLMGVPAGLKLNIPLNSALGHFFLYHIYLWEAYMAVVLPVFTFILKTSVVIGVLGVTFVLCLLSDLIAIATIHIYCFYGYAARLYGYQVIALSSLWRLFRGKKWNPLRERVDSYTYDIHQLFLGTLIFTVLLFLLPTVMIYYVVFTCLRIMVLTIQRIILKIIQAINVNPLYCIISRLLKSSEVAGDVYFSVLSAKGTLTFSMEVTQVSFKTVIKETLPKLNNTEEYLTWKEFLSSILVGKIIYPL